MIDLFRDVSEYCRLEIPKSHHRKIGIIGAGGIVAVAHLPAYELAGLPVHGITDLNLDKANELAEKFGIGRVYQNHQEMIDDPEIEVVDIAVPASEQPGIMLAALAAGKHILAQKPLATSVSAALALLEAVKSTKLLVAVNQQLRFDEGMAAAHRMVELGMIGEVTNFSITVNLDTPWELWEWAQSMERLEIMVHSIHYHDVVRWFMGEPESVYAIAGKTPGQLPIGETRTISSYRFNDGSSAVVHANHVNRGGDNTAEFRIDGTNGSIRGTLGLLYDYPTGRVDTLELNSKALPTDGWLPYPVTTRWIPHAFIGTMGSLLSAVATGTEMRSSLEDNVDTIKLVDALYTSVETNSVVKP
ncbi:MAG: Gfo/Idh/MocA family oxidoreductase [Aquiluna sp.]|jgi:predicted dehydrogenase|tara:strand:+ start:3399 stop:4475 length:1077 start_codon:yes stop_codon:yes gene_type:complete